jgi:hypothetical protein
LLISVEFLSIWNPSIILIGTNYAVLLEPVKPPGAAGPERSCLAGQDFMLDDCGAPAVNPIYFLFVHGKIVLNETVVWLEPASRPKLFLKIY